VKAACLFCGGQVLQLSEVSRLTILLVEDNPGDLLLIQQILTATIASVEIRLAMDGEQAIWMLADPEFKPDLILLDLTIPKVPGIAILAQCNPPRQLWCSAPRQIPLGSSGRSNWAYGISCINPSISKSLKESFGG